MKIYYSKPGFLDVEDDYSKYYFGYKIEDSYLICFVDYYDNVKSLFSTSSKNKYNPNLWNRIELENIPNIELSAILENCKYKPIYFIPTPIYSKPVLKYLLKENRLSEDYVRYEFNLYNPIKYPVMLLKHLYYRLKHLFKLL